MMRSVQRILGIFESFSRANTALTLQEIADSIGLPKSTTFRLVQSIEECGYLVRLEDKKYCLSLRVTRLAGLVKSTLDIREIARPIMLELAAKTQETVAIHTVMGRNRVCLDSLASSESPLRSVMRPGEEIPLQAGSASKTLLAHLPKRDLASVLPSASRLAKRTQGDLMAEFARIREQGFAVSHGERLLGLSAVSAPIFDINEEVHHCLTVNGPSVRIQLHEKAIVKLVKKAAGDISRQFGGRIELAP